MTNIVSKDYLTIEQVAKELGGITRQGAQEVVKKLGVSFKEVKKSNGGKPQKFYSIKEIRAMKQQQQQQLALEKIDTQAEGLANSKEEDIVANAFLKQQQAKLDYLPPEIKENTFNVVGVLLDTLAKYNETIKENEQIKTEVKELKIQLDKDNEYYSIKRVAVINGKSTKNYNWRELKDMSFKLQRDIKCVPDNNYGIVKSYHIDVWKAVYPSSMY